MSIPELRSPLPRASFLACPPDYCSVAEAVASPVFDLPWDRLRDYWVEMISGETRVVRAVADLAPRRYAYIQHSPLFRFPDIITVELIPLGPTRSKASPCTATLGMANTISQRIGSGSKNGSSYCRKSRARRN